MNKIKKRLAVIIIVAIIIAVFLMNYFTKQDQDIFLKKEVIASDEVIISTDFIEKVEACQRGEVVPYVYNLNRCDYLPEEKYLDDLKLIENLSGDYIANCRDQASYLECDNAINNIAEKTWIMSYKSSPTSGGHSPTYRTDKIIKIKNNYYYVISASPPPYYKVYRINIDSDIINQLKA